MNRMKKEWLCQLLALILFYLDSIISVEHEGVFISPEPGTDLLYILYAAVLFLTVNYVLIPQFFYKKKYVQFFLALIGTIIVFGIIEEAVVEQILSPNSRGKNAVTWQSIYWYFGEILIPLLTFMTIKFVFDNFEQQRKLERIEQDKLSNELKLLKSQMQPHILFNSLNNLYNFALKKSEEVPNLILKLSNVLRYVLYEAAEEKVPLEKELAMIEDYVGLQVIQYQNRGKITLNIARPTESETIQIAPFLLIPFVENGFKHSFGSLVENVFVEIDINISKGNLQLIVRNNFDENYEVDSSLTKGGIGLNNVKKRLELLYPKKYLLQISDEKQIYLVDLKIVLE